MKTEQRFSILLSFFVLILLSSSVQAQQIGDGLGSTYDIIVLTPGHSRSIYYELGDTIFNGRVFQTTFIVTAGAGTLTISVANHSTIDQGELIFSTAGFVGTTPVLNYAYSSAPIFMAIPVPDISVGIVMTGIVAAFGEPDFPVTMSMTFSLN
ncbi:MAG: hypothetical protein N3B18_07110 [Desulfobacterota bacterium]|nr:hypothetical protein [Thermodesulfobacteriota bacterium]